jgi:hypothetical protein
MGEEAVRGMQFSFEVADILSNFWAYVNSTVAGFGRLVPKGSGKRDYFVKLGLATTARGYFEKEKAPCLRRMPFGFSGNAWCLRSG